MFFFSVQTTEIVEQRLGQSVRLYAVQRSKDRIDFGVTIYSEILCFGDNIRT